MVSEINNSQPDWTLLGDQWERHLRAANKAPTTIAKYRRSLAKFAEWASAENVDRGPYDVTEDDVVAFIAQQFQTPTRYGRLPEPESVAIDFRQLKVFFGWLCRREKLPHPMQYLKAPSTPEKPVPLFTDDDLRRLLKAAGGDEFAARRDRAILRMLFDAGIRRAELAGLTLDSVNLREQYVTVLGKGRRIRTVPYGANTAESLDDYLRLRMRHRDHKLPALWLAASPHRGAFGYDGIHQMIQRIARRAGIPDAYAHRFRHTAVHTQLDGGMSEGEAMRIFGWNSPSMPRHYGSALAHARAMAAARRISHADRI